MSPVDRAGPVSDLGFNNRDDLGNRDENFLIIMNTSACLPGRNIFEQISFAFAIGR